MSASGGVATADWMRAHCAIRLGGQHSVYILGISCFYHDAAACLMKDGEVIAAAEEERFTRKKHDFDFPVSAIEYCLREAKIGIDQVDYVGFYEKPLIKFERIILSYMATFPRSFRAYLQALPLWLGQKLWIPSLIRRELDYNGDVLFADHHMSHAASAFLFSPFEEAAIFTTDGVGEWSTTTYGVGRGNRIEIMKEIRYPHSLGLFYSAVTAHLGFKVNNDEYKVMGLASYGEPTYYDDLKKVIDIRPDGSYQLDMSYFAYHYGLTMLSDRFRQEFGEPRERESEISQRHMDLAASLQLLLEEALLNATNHLYELSRMDALCMAGGVALNCVANGRILNETPFKDIWVQPAAGDDGGSIGVAAYIWNVLLDNPRTFVMHDAYFGPSYTTEEVRAFLDGEGIPYEEHDTEDLLPLTARMIADNLIVGWFQGRMEFGPRALGSRSILANPCNPDMKDILNDKVKHREDFRPFAPVLLREKVGEYLKPDYPMPFMVLLSEVREEKRDAIPSVTHVDGTARPQTVTKEHNGIYYDLVVEFEKITGVPVLINTSFNVRGEPIVCTPENAYRCFAKTGIDVLVMDRFVVRKNGVK